MAKGRKTRRDGERKEGRGSWRTSGKIAGKWVRRKDGRKRQPVERGGGWDKASSCLGVQVRFGKALLARTGRCGMLGSPPRGRGTPELGLSVRLQAGVPPGLQGGGARGCGLARAPGEGRRGASLVRRFRVYFPSSPCFCPRVPCCVLTPGHLLLIPQPRILQESHAWGALTPRRTPLSSSATPHSLPALVPNQGTGVHCSSHFFVLLAQLGDPSFPSLG